MVHMLARYACLFVMAAPNAADAADAVDTAADGEGAFAYVVSDVYADRIDVNATAGVIGDEIAAAMFLNVLLQEVQVGTNFRNDISTDAALKLVPPLMISAGEDAVAFAINFKFLSWEK